MENKKGGCQSRVGIKFFTSIENIKDQRLRNGKSKDRISTERITNLICSHKLWKQIIIDTINASEEEFNEYGK